MRHHRWALIWALCACLGPGLWGCGPSTVETHGDYLGDDSQGEAGGGGQGRGWQDGRTPQQSDQIVVQAPQEGAILKGRAVTVSGQAVGLEEVTVQGIPVPVQEDGSFSHELALAQEGDLWIEVRSGQEVTTRGALVDWTAPSLVLESPARGAFLRRGQQDRLEVRGQVLDLGGVATVSVNGQPVDVDPEGRFSTALSPKPGLNAVEVTATDRADRSSSVIHGALYGDFVPWGQVTPGAVSLRLSAQGLERVSAALSQNLGPEILQDIGADPQPGGDFQLRGLDLAGVEVGLTPLDGWLELRLQVYGLQVEFDTVYEGSPIRGEIESDPAEIIVPVQLLTDGAGGVDIALGEPEIELHDFDFDVGGLLGLVDWIIKGIVEDEIEKAVVEALRGFSLEDALTAETLSQATEILGRPAQLDLLLTQVQVDPQGLTAALDMGLEMEPAPHLAQAPGSWTSAAAPAPALRGDSELELALRGDFVNQLLGGLWRAGALDLDLGALLAQLLACGEGSLPFALDAQTLATLMGARELLQHADGDTPVGLKLRMGMPPLLRLGQQEGRPLTLEVGEVVFDFTLEDGTGRPWASIAVFLWVDLGVSLEQGAPKLDLAIRAKADLVEEPLFDLKDDSAEAALVTLLNTLPALLDGGGGCADPDAAPFQPGLSVEGLSLEASGAGSLLVSLGLGTRLVPPEPPALQILATEVNPDNGHTYHLLSVSSWSDAEAFAISLGGHLATVRDRDENRWLVDTFGYYEGATRDLWIGLHDVYGEGEFVWTSGEPVQWERWASRAPDNGRHDEDSSFREHFVHIYGDRSPRSDERWNDYKNEPYAPWNQGFHGVVEILPAP